MEKLERLPEEEPCRWFFRSSNGELTGPARLGALGRLVTRLLDWFPVRGAAINGRWRLLAAQETARLLGEEFLPQHRTLGGAGASHGPFQEGGSGSLRGRFGLLMPSLQWEVSVVEASPI